MRADNQIDALMALADAYAALRQAQAVLRGLSFSDSKIAGVLETIRRALGDEQ